MVILALHSRHLSRYSLQINIEHCSSPKWHAYYDIKYVQSSTMVPKSIEKVFLCTKYYEQVIPMYFVQNEYCYCTLLDNVGRIQQKWKLFALIALCGVASITGYHILYLFALSKHLISEYIMNMKYWKQSTFMWSLWLYYTFTNNDLPFP